MNSSTSGAIAIPTGFRNTTRAVVAGLAFAALGSAGAYGITALPADVAPTEDDQNAATAIEYGLIAAGISLNGLD
jgi:hypothetical protein